MKQKIINVDPELMGGTPVFMGTRVPITTLLIYLERGHGLGMFLDHFPSVTEEQALALCKMMGDAAQQFKRKNKTTSDEGIIGRATAKAA